MHPSIANKIQQILKDSEFALSGWARLETPLTIEYYKRW